MDVSLTPYLAATSLEDFTTVTLMMMLFCCVTTIHQLALRFHLNTVYISRKLNVCEFVLECRRWNKTLKGRGLQMDFRTNKSECCPMLPANVNSPREMWKRISLYSHQEFKINFDPTELWSWIIHSPIWLMLASYSQLSNWVGGY